jgi:hypothetical protein
MKLRYVNQCISFYENGLTDELCDRIWSFYYDNMELAKPGVTISGLAKSPDGSRWKHTIDQQAFEQGSEFHPLKQTREQIDEEIYQQLRPVITDYLERFTYLAEAPNITDTGYLWQMYRQNEGYYKEHVDGSNWVPKVYKRVGAILCYINTVEKGGETAFRYQDLKVKPEKGGVVVFPATWTYPHQALVPTSSDKLIISSFLECEPLFHAHEDH